MLLKNLLKIVRLHFTIRKLTVANCRTWWSENRVQYSKMNSDVQEKAEEYKKISTAQKRQINNCFLPKSAVKASEGNSGSEKAVLVSRVQRF
jgi:hypothetical protein